MLGPISYTLLVYSIDSYIVIHARPSEVSLPVATDCYITTLIAGGESRKIQHEFFFDERIVRTVLFEF